MSFKAVGVCNRCDRSAFGKHEIGKPCGARTADGGLCQGMIVDNNAPPEKEAPLPIHTVNPPPIRKEELVQREEDYSHEKYRIGGCETQYVECFLLPGETTIAEAGAFLYKGGEVRMDTIFGDGSENATSIAGKFLNPLKRKFSGESLLLTTFTNRGMKPQVVAFAAPHIGKIQPLHLADHRNEIHCQRGGFLCATPGVKLSPGLHRSVSATFFAGEGIVTQKILGHGTVFIHAGGSIVEHELSDDEELHVESGALVAWEGHMGLEIKWITSIKNLLFASEGIALTKIKGPGKLWTQSLPFKKMVARIYDEIPKPKPQ